MQAAIQDTSQPAVRWDRLVQAVQLLIVFLPVLITLIYVVAFSVEAPWSDDWDLFVPVFHHMAAGNLAWSDINAQHTDSIPLFPMAASLILAKITGGRLLAITYLSYGFLCGALGVLFLFFRLLRLPGRWSTLWFLPASLLFLGWRQWEGLLWSTHILNTMALFFVLLSIYCCTQVERAPIFYLGAIAAAWIASFSMASGLLVWFTGGVALLFVGTSGMRFEEKLRLTAGWLVVGAACGLCFFMDSGPSEVPWPSGMHYVLSNPLTAVRYVLTYLGASLGIPSTAKYTGIALVLIAIPIVFLAARNLGIAGVASSLSIALYLGTALVPLLSGRLGLGVPQASSSRYCTAGSLIPLGLYFCSLALAKSIRWGRYLVGAMILLIGFGIASSYSSGYVVGVRYRGDEAGCAASLRDLKHIDSHKPVLCGHPVPGVVIERTPWLAEYHLSLFAEQR